MVLETFHITECLNTCTLCMLKVRQRHLTSINYYTQIGTNAMQMLISIICKFGGQWYANLMVNDMRNIREE